MKKTEELPSVLPANNYLSLRHMVMCMIIGICMTMKNQCSSSLKLKMKYKNKIIAMFLIQLIAYKLVGYCRYNNRQYPFFCCNSRILTSVLYH
jgi:hypothetical protein